MQCIRSRWKKDKIEDFGQQVGSRFKRHDNTINHSVLLATSTHLKFLTTSLSACQKAKSSLGISVEWHTEAKLRWRLFLLSRCRDPLLELFPLQLLFWDWLLLLWRKGLLRIHIENIVPDEEEQQKSPHNKQDHQPWVQPFSCLLPDHISLLIPEVNNTSNKGNDEKAAGKHICIKPYSFKCCHDKLFGFQNLSIKHLDFPLFGTYKIHRTHTTTPWDKCDTVGRNENFWHFTTLTHHSDSGHRSI